MSGLDIDEKKELLEKLRDAFVTEMHCTLGETGKDNVKCLFKLDNGFTLLWNAKEVKISGSYPNMNEKNMPDTDIKYNSETRKIDMKFTGKNKPVIHNLNYMTIMNRDDYFRSLGITKVSDNIIRIENFETLFINYDYPLDWYFREKR